MPYRTTTPTLNTRIYLSTIKPHKYTYNSPKALNYVPKLTRISQSGNAISLHDSASRTKNLNRDWVFRDFDSQTFEIEI